jgi:GAF domain-containing protein
MTDDTMLAETPRQQFMEVAQQEMIAFERKEREFRRQAKQERATALGLPISVKEAPR